jgi:hypothetical protein
MSCKKKYCLILVALCLGHFAGLSAGHVLSNYPYFYDNPHLTERMQVTIAPYLLPLDHPMRPTLDFIFSQARVTESEKALVDAGFEIIAGPMKRSYIYVVRHPEIPGYVFKLYLDSEKRFRKEVPHWLSLTRRCVGAFGIRKIIEQEKICHFLVPDKWLYVLPIYPYSNVLDPEPIILMETDMEPENLEVSAHMWNTVTSKHLDELYAILKHGHGGSGTMSLFGNVPFTKKGKFAFIDTEKPKVRLTLKHIRKYLSKDMGIYWDNLIHKRQLQNPSEEKNR